MSVDLGHFAPRTRRNRNYLHPEPTAIAAKEIIMTINGEMFIGARAVRGTQGEIRAIQAETGEPIEPVFVP